MSEYCSVEEVNSLVKTITISTSSKITTAEVTAMIIRISNTMDGVVANQLDLPTTDTEALSVLKDICMKFCAADVVRILYMGSGRSIPKIAKDWHDEAQRILDGIADGTFALIGTASTDIVHTGTEDDDGNERDPNMGIAKEF